MNKECGNHLDTHRSAAYGARLPDLTIKFTVDYLNYFPEALFPSGVPIAALLALEPEKSKALSPSG